MVRGSMRGRTGSCRSSTSFCVIMKLHESEKPARGAPLGNFGVNEDGTREPLADAVRGLVFDDESKDDGGDDMETT